MAFSCMAVVGQSDLWIRAYGEEKQQQRGNRNYSKIAVVRAV